MQLKKFWTRLGAELLLLGLPCFIVYIYACCNAEQPLDPFDFGEWTNPDVILTFASTLTATVISRRIDDIAAKPFWEITVLVMIIVSFILYALSCQFSESFVFLLAISSGVFFVSSVIEFIFIGYAAVKEDRQASRIPAHSSVAHHH